MCGVNPVEASSGKIVRHRLNRSGNRQANHALWRIAFVRLSSDPTTKAYAARRTAEGKSQRECPWSQVRTSHGHGHRLTPSNPLYRFHTD